MYKNTEFCCDLKTILRRNLSMQTGRDYQGVLRRDWDADADEFTPVLEQPGKTSGQLQMLRNAAFDFVASKPRIRNNALLIRKARHGRLSGTRDHAFQLTLKVFASEGIDWQRAFVEEPIEVMADLMGPERMREILKEALKRLDKEEPGEPDWKPFGVEW